LTPVARQALAVVALARSGHPVPSVLVTGWAVLLAISARNTAVTCVLLAVAVLSGQLSVGWCNDRIDAARDRRVGHAGKPVAEGQISTGTVDAAIVGALAVTVTFSLLLGWRAGGLHLLAVASAWLYNLGLKRTVLSWLPYVAAFGALPAVATLALPGHPGPAAWAVAAAACHGVAVNFANALQYLAERPESDVHGLPDRIGGRASLVVAAVLVVAAAVTITAGPPGPPKPLAWAGLALTVGLVAVGIPLLWPRAGKRAPFYAMLFVVPIEVVVGAITGSPLH
jgi:4-hydroxybenzoate polyprenyltransferase